MTDRAGNASSSSDECFHHVAVHVRQPHVAAAEVERQPFVVDPEQMQDRGVQVVDMHFVFDRVVPVLVGRAVDVTRPSNRRRPSTS